MLKAALVMVTGTPKQMSWNGVVGSEPHKLPWAGSLIYRDGLKGASCQAYAWEVRQTPSRTRQKINEKIRFLLICRRDRFVKKCIATRLDKGAIAL